MRQSAKTKHRSFSGIRHRFGKLVRPAHHGSLQPLGHAVIVQSGNTFRRCEHATGELPLVYFFAANTAQNRTRRFCGARAFKLYVPGRYTVLREELGVAFVAKGLEATFLPYPIVDVFEVMRHRVEGVCMHLFELLCPTLVQSG